MINVLDLLLTYTDMYGRGGEIIVDDYVWDFVKQDGDSSETRTMIVFSSDNTIIIKPEKDGE